MFTFPRPCPPLSPLTPTDPPPLIPPPRPRFIHHPIPLELRPLGINNIPQLAPIKPNLFLLLLIKNIKPLPERIMQIGHIPLRMQRLPRPDTSPPLARLEHKQQRIQPGNHLVKLHPKKSLGLGSCRMKQIVGLVGVSLSNISIFAISCQGKKGKGGGGASHSNHKAHAHYCTKPRNKNYTPSQ